MSLDKFMAVYAKHLRAQVAAHPERYVYNNESDTSRYLAAMAKAVRVGNFLKDTPTFVATCKELGIKHTYKAIAQFIARVE